MNLLVSRNSGNLSVTKCCQAQACELQQLHRKMSKSQVLYSCWRYLINHCVMLKYIFLYFKIMWRAGLLFVKTLPAYSPSLPPQFAVAISGDIFRLEMNNGKHWVTAHGCSTVQTHLLTVMRNYGRVQPVVLAGTISKICLPADFIFLKSTRQ